MLASKNIFYFRPRKPPLTRFGKCPILAASSMKRLPIEGFEGQRQNENDPRGWVCTGPLDGRACGPRSDVPSARMRVGTLRFIQSGVDRMSRPGSIPGLHGDQSLPETCGVLCPPGTRPFRESFFARTARILACGHSFFPSTVLSRGGFCILRPVSLY